MADESKSAPKAGEPKAESAGKRKVFVTGSVTHNGRAYRNEYIEDLTDAQAERLTLLGYGVEGEEAAKAERAAAKAAKAGASTTPSLPGGATNPDARESAATGKAGPDPVPAKGSGAKTTESQKASASAGAKVSSKDKD